MAKRSATVTVTRSICSGNANENNERKSTLKPPDADLFRGSAAPCTVQPCPLARTYAAARLFSGKSSSVPGRQLGPSVSAEHAQLLSFPAMSSTEDTKLLRRSGGQPM